MIVEWTKQRQRLSCRWLLIFLVACSFLAGRSHAAVLVVHDSVPVETMSVQELRTIYTMGFSYWKDGTAIQVFVLPQRSNLHQSFCKTLLRAFPHQLQAAWDRIVYSGMGKAPIEVESEQDMIERIRRTPGAIGYVSGKDVSQAEGIRSVEVRP